MFMTNLNIIIVQKYSSRDKFQKYIFKDISREILQEIIYISIEK